MRIRVASLALAAHVPASAVSLRRPAAAQVAVAVGRGTELGGRRRSAGGEGEVLLRRRGVRGRGPTAAARDVVDCGSCGRRLETAISSWNRQVVDVRRIRAP